MTWLEICSVTGTLAFLVLVCFIAWALIAAKRTLDQLERTLAQAQQTLQQASDSSTKLLESSTRLTDEIYGKSKSLQGLFDSIHEAGLATSEAASAMRKASAVFTQSVNGAQKVAQAHQKRLQDGIEWATTGIELWQRWQAYRQSKVSSEQSCTSDN